MTASTILVGNRIADGASVSSVWAYDAAGDLVWTYDTGAQTTSVIIDNGFVYITGYSADNGTGTANLWKLTAAGVYVGNRYVRSTSITWCVVLDTIGRIIVGTGAGAARVAVDLSSEEIIYSAGTVLGVAVDSNDNSIYIGSGGTYPNLRKYNSSLAWQWQQDPTTAALATGVEVMSNQNVVFSSQYTGGLKVCYCYDKDGNFEWEYGGITTNANCLVLDSNDNVYLGTSDTAGKSFIKLNSSGVEQWSITHDYIILGAFVGTDDVVYATGNRKGSVLCWKEISQTLTDAIQCPTAQIKSGYTTSNVTPTIAKVDYYYDNLGGGLDFAGSRWNAQTFYATESHTLKGLKMPFYRQGAPAGNTTISIKAVDGSHKPTGADLASVSFDGNAITTITPGEWNKYLLTPEIALTIGVEYAIVMRTPAGNIFNRLLVNGQLDGDGYANGQRWQSYDSGANWTTYSQVIHFETLKPIYIAPEITAESTAQTLANGQILNLSVTASGDPTPTYQWYHDDIAIVGATLATYTAVVSLTDAGNYKVVVTNLGGSATSSQIPVTVTANPYRINMFNLYLDHNQLS